MTKENWDIWFDKYEPIQNFDGRFTCFEQDEISYSWETYGRDWDIINRMDEKYIWTLVDCDGDEVFIAGRWHVNRLAYFVCRAPYVDGELSEYCYTDYSEHLAERVHNDGFVHRYRDSVESYDIDELEGAIECLENDDRDYTKEIAMLKAWRGIKVDA